MMTKSPIFRLQVTVPEKFGVFRELRKWFKLQMALKAKASFKGKEESSEDIGETDCG